MNDNPFPDPRVKPWIKKYDWMHIRTTKWMKYEITRLAQEENKTASDYIRDILMGVIGDGNDGQLTARPTVSTGNSQ